MAAWPEKLMDVVFKIDANGSFGATIETAHEKAAELIITLWPAIVTAFIPPATSTKCTTSTTIWMIQVSYLPLVTRMSLRSEPSRG